MGVICKRKFGVKRINMRMEQGNLLCIECGNRAGLHYGDTYDCPKHLPKNEDIITRLKQK